MPSAQSKLEKQTSNEVLDPSKQIITLVEKKVRNLEKRKGKLDTYKNESKAGKELNEDQKNAITKYDNVVEQLELVKDLQKQFSLIQQENLKNQKKQAKREQLERQQNDIKRLKELFLYQILIVKLKNEDIRNDLLLGAKGIQPFSEEVLNQLIDFSKLVTYDEERDTNIEDYLSSAAEHFYLALEGRNKEIVGTTYKQIKETLTQISECGYFTKKNDIVDEEVLAEPEVEAKPEPLPEKIPEVLEPKPEDFVPLSNPVVAQPLHDVLPVQGNFNFLQESQIDIEAHIDPAIVAAHPMVPTAVIGFPQAATQFQPPPPPPPTQAEGPNSQIPLNSTTEENSPSPKQHPSTTEATPALPAEYDPSCPIPTQTFTNQNFALHHHPHSLVHPSVVGNLISPLSHVIPVSILPQPQQQPPPSEPPREPSPPIQQSAPVPPSEHNPHFEAINEYNNQKNDHHSPPQYKDEGDYANQNSQAPRNNVSNGNIRGGIRPNNNARGRGVTTNGYQKNNRNINPKNSFQGQGGYYQAQSTFNTGNYGGNPKRGTSINSRGNSRGSSRGGGSNRNFRQ